jgi:PAS domain S-box-containing protein
MGPSNPSDFNESERVHRLIQGLLQAAPDGVVVVNHDGEIVYVNSQTEALFGYRTEELVGRKVEMLMPVRFRGRHTGYREDYFTRPTVRPMGAALDLYGLRRDGTEFPVEISLGPLETYEGTLVISAIRDVTERKRVVEALRESEERFRRVFEEGPLGVALVGKDRRFLKVNDSYCRLVGYSESELNSMTFDDITYPDDVKTDVDFAGRLLNGEILVYHRAKRYVRKSGEIIWVNLTASLIRDGKGVPLYFLSMIEDINETKRMNDALRENEERLRVALKASPVVVFNQDRELRYTWINSPVLAWASQEYLGRTDAEIVGGEEGARLTAIKQEVLQSGVGSRTEVVVTFMGQTHHFDLTVEPLRDSRGTLVGITCACTDVTPLKQAAAERERLIGELQDALTKVKLLSGLLPICAYCKRIQDEQGSWRQLESYIHAHSEADFSHGICQECAEKLYPDSPPK